VSWTEESWREKMSNYFRASNYYLLMLIVRYLWMAY